MDFIYAAELKKRFNCYGHFYEMQLIDGSRVPCRSVLEIVDQSIPQDDASRIWERKADVVVVMMNPGSSHPLQPGYEAAVIEYPRTNSTLSKELVPTQPDNTQYQVMRIAVEMGWSHIRVLNLSDLRDPKSGRFIQRVEELSGIAGGHAHSLFCPERRRELSMALRRSRPTPILLGWGQDPGLVQLAEQCLAALGDEPTRTVASEVHPLLNSHPSPMLQSKKLQWLDAMLAALAS